MGPAGSATNPATTEDTMAADEISLYNEDGSVNPLALILGAPGMEELDTMVEAEEAARKAAKEREAAAKVADYNAAGFFWSNLDRRYNCARCSGRGAMRYYRHVAGGICFNCNGEGFRL